IAQGDVLGPFDEFELAVNAVERRDPGTFHAYVYRPGVDDVDFALDLDTSGIARAFVGAALTRRLAEASGREIPNQPLWIDLLPIAPFEDVSGFTTDGTNIGGIAVSDGEFDLALEAK